MQEKAAGVGFDWEHPRGALAKVREEVEEVAAALDAGAPDALREELGDLIFSVVNLARLAGLHAGPALEEANGKFRRRFLGVEARARAQDLPLPGSDLATLDALWNEVKAAEAREAGSAPDEGGEDPPAPSISTPPPDPPGS
jgi:nucleoside triphosphate diphosphatase